MSGPPRPRSAGPEADALGDSADEWVDLVAGDEGAHRGQRPGDLDLVRAQADLLLRLAQGRVEQRLLRRVRAAARERDLAGVAPQVEPALGEDEPGSLRMAVQAEQHR